MALRAHGRAAATLALLLANVAFWATLILIVGFFKFFLPQGPLRRRIIRVLAGFGDRWAAGTNGIVDRMLDVRWDFSGFDGLRNDGRYLIVSNHVSWVDIIALFRVFAGRVPFVRFFMKHRLLYFPLVGQACQALEFPFLRRYSPEYLERHPEKRGADIRTTRRACRRYKEIPVAMLVFPEGTRFRQEKHADQDSPYRHLLRPRIGALSHILAVMGDQLDEILDVSIAYPDGRVSFHDFLLGRMPRVIARMRRIAIPESFRSGMVVEDAATRAQFKEWVTRMWSEKDLDLDAILGSANGVGPVSADRAVAG